MSKIICGDSLEVMRGFTDKQFDLVLTDIPYNAVNRTGVERAKYNGQLRRLDKQGADSLPVNLIGLIDELDRITKGSIYIFCGWQQIGSLLEQLQQRGWSTRLCVWEKTNPSPMNGQHLWLNASEFCVFARKPKATFNEVCAKNIWHYPAGSSKIHPTQKPLKLFKYLVQVSSNEGDYVLDPYLGSGTTTRACKDLNRNYIGIEINEAYVEIAKKRLAQEVLL